MEDGADTRAERRRPLPRSGLLEPSASDDFMTRQLVVPSPLTPTLSRKRRGSQKLFRRSALLLIQRYWASPFDRPSAFASSGLTDWSSASGVELGRAKTPPPSRPKLTRAPVPAPNRVMDQGRRRSGLRPCAKKFGRHGEIQEICCFAER
jgi:hypothetical protein